MENKEKYTTGFKVPSNYFEKLEDNLLDIISEEKLPKTAGFKLPEKYFETLEEDIISKTFKEKETKIITIFSKKNRWYSTSIAAGILLLILISLNSGKTDPNNWELTEIETYINNNIDFETLDIAQLINEEDIDNLQSETLSFPEENIENYLLDRLDDTSLLNE